MVSTPRVLLGASKGTISMPLLQGQSGRGAKAMSLSELGFSSKDRSYLAETARGGLVSRWVQERRGGPGPIQGCYGGGSSFWSCSNPPKLWVPGAHCPTSPQLLQPSASRPAAEAVHSITEQGFVVCFPYARHCVGNITRNKTRNPPSEQILVEFTI